MFIELVKDHLGQKAGYRFDTDEPVAKALIEQGIAKGIQGNPLEEIIAKSMEGMLANLTNALNQTIDSTLKAFASNQTKSRKNAVPAIFGSDGVGEGDPKHTFGSFLLAIRTKNLKVLEEMGSAFVEWTESADKKTAMSTQTGANGGFLVPTEFYTRLMGLVVEKSIFRARSTIIPMSSRSTQIPVLDITTAQSAGDTAFLGGVVARWTEEATTETETEPNLKQAELTNYELSGYSILSNALVQDSAIGLEEFLYQLFSRAIAWYEDYAFMRGNGAGKPLGVQSWAGLISATRTTSNLFKLDDVANMYSRLLPGGDESSIVWVMHPFVLAQLIKMTGGDNVIFLGNDLNGKPKMKILNYDVAISEKVPALGSANDVTLCDCNKYVIGDRRQVEIAFSEHVDFLKNRSVWRFVSRVGGMPWLRDKVTLADASSTLSPFIGLAA